MPPYQFNVFFSDVDFSRQHGLCFKFYKFGMCPRASQHPVPQNAALQNCPSFFYSIFCKGGYAGGGWGVRTCWGFGPVLMSAPKLRHPRLRDRWHLGKFPKNVIFLLREKKKSIEKDNWNWRGRICGVFSISRDSMWPWESIKQKANSHGVNGIETKSALDEVFFSFSFIPLPKRFIRKLLRSQIRKLCYSLFEGNVYNEVFCRIVCKGLKNAGVVSN